MFAWNWRGYFLIKRCALSDSEDLDYICANGNIGDWFLLYMLGSNLDPLIMRNITTEIANKMRKDDKEFRTGKPEKKKRTSRFGSFRKFSRKKKEDSNCLSNELKYHLQSTAPPASYLEHNHGQYNQYLDQNHMRLICGSAIVNRGYNDAMNNYNKSSCCVDNCCSDSSNNYPTKNRTNYQQNLNFIKQKNELVHSNCIGCFSQQTATLPAKYVDQQQKSNYFETKEENCFVELEQSNQTEAEDDEEIINCCSDNKESLAIDHCLRSKDNDQCALEELRSTNYLNRFVPDKNNMKSIKKEELKDLKPKNSLHTVSSHLDLEQSNSTKSKLSDASELSNKSNLTNSTNLTNLDNLNNQVNISRKSYSNCTNNCYSNGKSRADSELSSLANSSSGVGLDFESKLNGSNSELSINANDLQALNQQEQAQNNNQNSEQQQSLSEEELTQSFMNSQNSQHQSSGYHSNILSNNSTSINSDSSDQISVTHHDLEHQTVVEDNLIKECKGCKGCSSERDENSEINQEKKSPNTFNFSNMQSSKKNSNKIFNFKPFSNDKDSYRPKESLYDYKLDKRNKTNLFSTKLNLPFIGKKSSLNDSLLDENNRVIVQSNFNVTKNNQTDKHQVPCKAANLHIENSRSVIQESSYQNNCPSSKKSKTFYQSDLFGNSHQSSNQINSGYHFNHNINNELSHHLRNQLNNQVYTTSNKVKRKIKDL